MADLSPLWHPAFKKETMDLLVKLWAALDEKGRNSLASALLAGPSAEPQDADDERQRSRDWTAFQRLAVLERVQEPPLVPALLQKLAKLRSRYPMWSTAQGERAHFASWGEVRWGPDSRFSFNELAEMDDEALSTLLRTEFGTREGTMEIWRQLVAGQPQRGFRIMESMGAAPDPGPADVWEYGLLGLRNAENAGQTTDRMVLLLTKVPDALFATSDVTRAAADLLETLSRDLKGEQEPEGFWDLFDRMLPLLDAAPLREETEKLEFDWVHGAINHLQGRVAAVFFNALFARRPRVGAGIPADLITRADRLMSDGNQSRLFARVIGASRVSYLYAVDPEWTTRMIIPSFAWTDERESIAAWQGFAWQARIDPELWSVLKPHFISIFESNRLQGMAEWGQNIAQTLVLVGVVFGPDEIKRDTTRNAIRAMPERLRREAASWIRGYVQAAQRDNTEAGQEPTEGSSDQRWRERVWPWLKRVWPIEAAARSQGVAEQFALAVIATDDAFPEAVKQIQSFAVKSSGFHLLHDLAASPHPDVHPEATLELLCGFVHRDQIAFFVQELAPIIDRIGTNNIVRDDNRFKQWSSFIAERLQ